MILPHPDASGSGQWKSPHTLCTRSRVFRSAIFLAVMALVSLASMPFGYMPASDADGDFMLRICDGTMWVADDGSAGASQVAEHAMADHEMGHGDPDRKSDSGHETRCNYAVSGLTPVPQAPAIGSAPLVQPIEAPLGPAPLTGIFPAKLPPSTGPPSV